MDASMFAGLDTKSKANEGAEIEIMKADGESSGLFITVLGQDSDAYQKVKDRQDRARVKALSKGGRGAVDGIYDQSKDNEMQLVIACCVSWRHANGKGMPFRIGEDEEQTKQLFTEFPLIYDQVRVGINDRMNFTRAQATP